MINSDCKGRIVRTWTGGGGRNLTVAAGPIGDRVENSRGSVAAEGFTMIRLEHTGHVDCRITDRKRNIEQVRSDKRASLFHAVTRLATSVTEAPSYFCSTEFVSQTLIDDALSARSSVIISMCAEICAEKVNKIKSTWFVVLYNIYVLYYTVAYTYNI